jgi:NAD(P)-dependent dehydrogenase (short-subunit alcohol dehydrogenase family)
MKCIVGIYEAKPFIEVSEAEWHRLSRSSASGLPGIILPPAGARLGRVIFIASESGLLPPAEMIHYGMSKIAPLSIARGRAEQTGGTGVAVNSVLPGPTRSEGLSTSFTRRR